MRNTEKLNKLVQWMKAKNMEPSTINNYQHHLVLFFEWSGDDSSRISGTKIQEYILNIPGTLSHSYKNQAINAIKLYFKVIENKEFNSIILPRPKKDKFIPNVLTEDQAERVIFNTTNLKHRAILFTIYDNGLRISELINLTLMDLRTKCDNPHLVIKNAKHHSSRTIEVSKRFLEVITEYYREFHPRNYLFEGINGEAYSKTSIRNILNAALKREGIKYRIRVHDLRHSFATHCLANETDIHHLSNVLGHNSVKTTEKHYSHLRFNQIKIHRPLSSSLTKETKLRICG